MTEELVYDMIEKVQAVFLWVRLAMKNEMLPGLRYADDVPTLRKRLERLPKGRFAGLCPVLHSLV